MVYHIHVEHDDEYYYYHKGKEADPPRYFSRFFEVVFQQFTACIAHPVVICGYVYKTILVETLSVLQLEIYLAAFCRFYGELIS